jgi:SAM-dependent methyltransferase
MILRSFSRGDSHHFVSDRVALFRAGVAGLALMRLTADGSGEEVAATLRALRGSLKAGRGAAARGFPERDARSGYREWAGTYDSPGNPLIVLEETVMGPVLARLPAGDALDAASGTGRHARRLTALGHRVTAVDASPEMLSSLRGSGVRAVVADMKALPLPDATFDLAICSLALTHVPALRAPLTELARVVRRGGSLVLSDIHPVIAALGGHAYYRAGTGDMRFVRNRAWWPSDYLEAFAGTGLEVTRCHEPALGAAGGVPHFLDAPSGAEDAAARVAFDGLPGAIVWELRRP